jgi:hypothetical protein
MSAKDMDCTPEGRGPSCASRKPASLWFTQIWYDLRPPPLSHTRKTSELLNKNVDLAKSYGMDEPAKQSPLRSTTALLCGFDNVH